MVELLIDGSWVNITSKVMVRDSGGQISISRGQTSEGQDPNLGTCSFQLNNQDGLFSPANPMSPYYGKIGRNTQLRVSVPLGDDKNYRFWGEIPSWPENWDSTGRDIWVDISAAGILQRLNQASTPLRSTMYRGLMSAAVTSPVAYWSLEDMSAATSLASALSGGPPMRISGTPTLSSDTGFDCSAALPVMAGASFSGIVPKYTVTGKSQVRFLMYLPTPPPDGTQLIKCATTGGTIPYWCVTYGTGGTLSLKGFDTDGLTVLVSSGAIGFGVDGVHFLVSMELTQSGANINWSLGGIVTTSGISSLNPSSFASQTVGRITSVTVTPGRTITDGVFGHVSVQPDVTFLGDVIGQAIAFLGETVSNRLTRLCSEQGVNYTNVGPPFSNDVMGTQLPNTFRSLIQECVEVDQGILFEREVAFGLAYKARAALYSQTPVITLSYPGNQLSQIPVPVPDDQYTKNDWTVSRLNGSSATSTLDAGPLSVQDPPNGVGSGYSDSISLNLRGDAYLGQHASWRLHLGTVDEPRYPAISANLSHSSMATQRRPVLKVLFGSRIAIDSPPERIGGDISQLVIGIQETLTHFEHRITFVCVPESPYHVGVVGTSRAGSDTSTLAGDMTPTSTAVAVATPPTSAMWTADPTDVPFDITSGGEQMTVQAVGRTLNANPTFEADLTDWSQINSTLTRTTVQAHTGTWSGLITSGAGSNPRAECGQQAVTAGASYRAWGWMYVPAAVGTGVELDINWFDASHAYLSTSAMSAVPSVGVWQLFDLTATAPGTAAFADIATAFSATPGAGLLLYVDDVRLIPVSSYATSPQTFTVVRSVNGVVKTHQANDPIALFDINYAGL